MSCDDEAVSAGSFGRSCYALSLSLAAVKRLDIAEKCLLVHFRTSKPGNFPALRARYDCNDHYSLLYSSGNDGTTELKFFGSVDFRLTTVILPVIRPTNRTVRTCLSIGKIAPVPSEKASINEALAVHEFP
uniref:Uncharacterized protein n=1 Tax=Romanomermis culicivorax TaxID=13658 RepID=A0A915JJH1_ROMCU